MEWIDVKKQMPQSGKTVLLFGKNEYGKSRRLRAFFAEKNTIQDDNEYEAAEYCEEKDDYFLREGWYEYNEHDEVSWLIVFPVTHWMELPQPPV